MEVKELECALEAILFAAGEPVELERICAALEMDRQTLEGILQNLADGYSYQRRGLRLVRMEDSCQLCSAPEYASAVRRALESRKPPRLSQPALEALSVVAYFQPVTRAYIDQVRGVDSSYTVGLLLERELIEEAGRLAVPGRPIQYRTTKNFLRAFGLRSLEELPELPAQEDGQMTMEMQARLGQLQREQEEGESAP
ncbi:MAG: SMC-Scp complex subunit ScpB [Oscillospiraceae bacterium]|nr:SMC-Scp complex subunit ScpB [Oscillospiraceae bacterium]